MRFHALLFLTCTLLQAADRPDPARLAKIPLRMKEFVDEGKAAGIVTLVASHGAIASLEAVGYRELETKSPMRTDTIVRIASLTKPITCAAIMALVDDGRLSVLDPVEKFLPEFKAQKTAASVTLRRPVNVLDLMTHTSGLPGAIPEGKYTTLAEQASAAAKLTLRFEPGTAWNYSNAGYITLGRIVEVISKKPFDQFLKERIFDPLGMKDTTFFPGDDLKPRIAAVYTDDRGTLIRATSVEASGGPRIPAPQGGLFSTATDLWHFNQMIANKGTFGGRRVLSAAAAEMMSTSMTGDITSGFAPGAGHGLGYEVIRTNLGTFRYNSIGSSVKGGAYRTYEFIDPAKDLVGVILLQRTNGGGDMADEISAFLAMAASAVNK